MIASVWVDQLAGRARSQPDDQHEECLYVRGRCRWRFLSAAHVASHKRHFPGAVLRRSSAQEKGTRYVTAGGGKLTNNGECDTVFTQDASDSTTTLRQTTFQNADVSVPMFSIKHVTKEQHEVTFREHDGYILRVPTGRRYYFVCVSDV